MAGVELLAAAAHEAELAEECERPAALRRLAALLLREGRARHAAGCAQAALKIDPSDADADALLDAAKSLAVPAWHFRMLNDRRRNDAYRDALAKVAPGVDLALDLGCGTALLAAHAIDAGAKRAVAVDESSAMCDVATRALERAALHDRVAVVRGSSFELELPERAGLLVAELFDAGAFGERALSALLDARLRLLAPDAAQIPRAIVVRLCGVSSATLAKRHRAALGAIAVRADEREPYDAEDLTRIADVEYVTDALVAFDVDLTDEARLRRLVSPIGESRALRFEPTAPIDAFVAWFELRLTDEISITTDPRSAERCTAWDVAVFHPPARIEADAVELTVRCRSGGLSVDPLVRELDALPVDASVVRALNDAAYVELSSRAARACCDAVAVTRPLSSLTAYDANPFPVAGIAMLERGVGRLACDSRCRAPALRYADAARIDRTRLCFVRDGEQPPPHEMFVNCFVEADGRLRSAAIDSFVSWKTRHSPDPFMYVPYRVTMVARLTFSEFLDGFNRVNDSNLRRRSTVGRESLYEVSPFMNAYQVSYNSFRASDEFDRTYLSDERVVYEQCASPRFSDTLDVRVTNTGRVNAIECYYKIDALTPAIERISMNRPDSHINVVYHLLDPPVPVKKGTTVNVLVFCENTDNIKMVLDTEF